MEDKIMRRLFSVLSIAGILFTTSGTLLADSYPDRRVLLPYQTVATAADLWALRYNPAALAADNDLQLLFAHTYTDSDLSGNDLIYVGKSGLALGIEWLGSGGEPNARHYTLAWGGEIKDRIFLGTSYRWVSSEDKDEHKAHFWTHSLMVRPGEHFSFGVRVENSNHMPYQGRRTDAIYAYSAGLNFADGRIIFGTDYYQGTGQRLADGSYHLYAGIEPLDGLILYGDYGDQARPLFGSSGQSRKFGLGVRLNLTDIMFSSYNAFNKDGDFFRGNLAMGSFKKRRRTAFRVRREVADISLSGRLVERQPPRFFFAPRPHTQYEILTVLDKVATDPAIKGLLLRLGNLEVGWAKLAELRHALGRIRQAGKPVVVFFAAGPSDGEYYLASAADWIVCPPVSVVGLNGLRAEATFYKRTLDKLGVAFEFERIGKFKSAVELVSRTSLSDPAREAHEALLDDIYHELTTKIADGRGMAVDRVHELIDHGPYVSLEAEEAGLVDQIAYEDELDDIVREKIARHARRVNLKSMGKREYHRYQWGPIPKVAVIFAEGMINSGADRDYPFLGKVMGAQTIAKAIRAARKDCDVKAIVLRIDSPGGSGVASDLIWREVKKTIGKKPLVVSMSDVAASGGYYIACAADSIFASAATITGSIGVIAGKVSLAGLYGKIGIDKEVLTRGAHADIYSLNRPFTEEERQVVRHQVEVFYDNFIKIVADGRRQTPEQIHEIAQGRVWTGKAAKQVGLVDDFGGLPRAIHSAAQMAGIDDKNYEVTILPRADWFAIEPQKLLFGLFGHPTRDLFADFSALADEHLWYLSPWSLEIR